MTGELLALLGLLALLLVKEAGVPVPVPGDLLVLGAGVAAAAAGPVALLSLVGILAAGFVGGSIQFALVRGALRHRILRLLARFGVPEARIEQLAGWIRARGAGGVAVARATPGLRVGAIAASGVAGLPYRTFLAGLVAGNSLFVGGHFALGFVVGPPAVQALAGAGGLLLAVGAFVALAVLGAILWAAIRRRRRADATASAESGLPKDIAAPASWTEAACPACLGISIVRGAQS